jgi:hypothetical protein
LAGGLLGSEGMRLEGAYLRQAEEELRKFFFGDEEKLNGWIC